MSDVFANAIGPVLIVIGLLVSIRHFKAARTVSYIERFNHPDMASTRATVDVWLASSTSDDERYQAAKDDPELDAKINAFMNIFTELGIAYRFGLLDKKIAFAIWDVLAPNYWVKLKFYIEASRHEGRGIAFSFEYFAREISPYEEPLKSALKKG